MYKHKALMESVSSNFHLFVKKIGKNLSKPTKNSSMTQPSAYCGPANPSSDRWQDICRTSEANFCRA